MAQQSVTETLDPPSQDRSQSAEESTDPSLSRNVSFSMLNAKAPEFIPLMTGSGRSDGQPQPQPQPQPQLQPQQKISAPPPGAIHMYPGSSFVPIQNHHHHHVAQHHHPGQYHHGYNNHHQFYAGGRGDAGGGHREWEQEVKIHQTQNESQDQAAASKNLGPSEEVTEKVVNQVEYYFSDLNLATTDHLMRFINKDPEGYVPMSVVASFKKIKAFTSSHSQLASILRNSTKLVVSEDGKKIKRQHPLTEVDLEELQSRIVVAENLPEDHCYQNLMKLFSAVGCVKTIRTCQPQSNNGGSTSASRSAKTDGMHISNKLHAFVEYETLELAEKAVAELNDETNWRSGLKVKFFPRPMPKPAHSRGRKGHDGEGHNEEEIAEHQSNDKALENSSCQPDVLSHEQVAEENVNDREGHKKGRGRGRGKGRGRGQPHHHNSRTNQHIGTSNQTSNEHPNVSKQPPGPRMPDGTRGFFMGRGKPSLVSETTHNELIGAG